MKTAQSKKSIIMTGSLFRLVSSLLLPKETMNLSYISIKTLILVSSIALTACGGGGGGSNDDNDDSASDDPGAGTTEAIEKFFFHTYADSGSFSS